ncbi:hypothetical protein C3489_13120 [Streptomyces sp. Ru71]|uniref:DUF6891 domain-containing protein n=1 Tax=Streptomyces sp. Ru71 TaxID=2080746 RepID=UPI000CDE122D|nr:hypothetical protein [Streptomyces sp. Ru71]POX54817.1 hypothetical protein C3489_13120 [Streptomyces sp. Ru71]
MEIDGDLAVKAETEYGDTLLRPSADGLRDLVHRVGEPGDRWIVVQRIPDLPLEFAQVWHETGGGWRLEHRRGWDAFFGADLTDPERVARLLTGWARREPGWDAGVEWVPIEVGPREEVPPLDPEVAARAEEHVREMLADGYLGIQRLVQETVYLMEDAVSTAQAQQIVERLWLERVAEQEGWSGPTDPDRLTEAFAALERDGIVAREDFTCCHSCGMAEIGGEVREPEKTRGFVFFHHQGTRAAAEGHGLSLYYGGFDGSEETTAAIGREVVTALQAAGLSTDWDGDPGRAVEVTPLLWRRRLVG